MYYEFYVRRTQIASVYVKADSRDEAELKMADAWEGDEGFWRELDHEFSLNDSDDEYEYEGETDDVYGVVIG